MKTLTALVTVLFMAQPLMSLSAPVAASTAKKAETANPLLRPFKNTEHNTPPFNAIDNSMWLKAIQEGITRANKDIDAIASQKAKPTFKNTIEALDCAGEDLSRVLGVFYALLSAEADDQMMEVSVVASRLLSEYSTSITLNEKLWQRVRQVYDNRDALKLASEDSMLLQRTYESFARNGATLEGEARQQYKNLSSELSELTTLFGQNVLKEVNTYEVWLSEEDLQGLPESSIEAAAKAASDKGRAGEFLFTLDQPVYIAFMKYSSRADLRERMYRLYTGRNTSGKYNNIDVMTRIADLRHRLANLLGYKTYAAYNLTNTMAGTPEAVYDLLGRLRQAYTPALEKEMASLTAFASKYEGKPVTIHPWDYSYYSNKQRAAEYAFDEEAMRPYFELSNVIKGVFGLATRLYGVTFTPNPGVQVYHPDVTAYDVKDEKGKFLGVFYTDFFPRAGKRPGAWMTNFKEQWKDAKGKESRPQVTIVMNFTKPTADKPSLLTPYEVETFLHEFGHALHGLLADTKYRSLSGTNVFRDFVELPSQFNENFLTERQFLDTFARHYITGEAIPDSLVDGLIRSSRYGAAYSCMRQLAFGYLDMAWHTIEKPVDDPVEFEIEAVKPVRIFPTVCGSMTSPQFSHIFSGGYAAGYYSYKWSEVLDADAFSVFKKNGIFDAETAHSFRDNILKRGGTENPAELYRRFRGGDPTIDALLHRDGIK